MCSGVHEEHNVEHVYQNLLSGSSAWILLLYQDFTCILQMCNSHYASLNPSSKMQCKQRVEQGHSRRARVRNEARVQQFGTNCHRMSHMNVSQMNIERAIPVNSNLWAAESPYSSLCLTSCFKLKLATWKQREPKRSMNKEQ